MNQLSLESLGYSVNIGQILLFLGGFSAFCLSLWGGFKVARLGWMVAAFVFSGWVTQVRAALTMLLISGTALAGWAGHRLHLDRMFTAQVTEYVLAAYKTDDPEKAKKYLTTAQAYLETTGKTDGFTSIAYPTPDEDLGDWSASIKDASEFEATGIKDDRKPWQRKLLAAGLVNEVEIQGGKKRLDLNYPGGVSAAPYNSHVFWLGIGSLTSLVGSFLWMSLAMGMAKKKAKLAIQLAKENCLCPKVTPNASSMSGMTTNFATVPIVNLHPKQG